MADTDLGDTGVSAPIGWPATVVAVAIVALVGAITVAAIMEYKTPDDALEMWTAMSGLVGLITGVFVTYFFTRGAVVQAENQAKQARQLARSAQRFAERQAERADIAQRALAAVAGHVDKAEWMQIQKDPAVEKALSTEQAVP